MKYHIFTLSLVTDLLQSLSSSWLKWLILDQFTATSSSQLNGPEITSSCSVQFSLKACSVHFPSLGLRRVLSSLGRLDPVAKEEKTRSKIELSDHINTMMYSKVSSLIKHRLVLSCRKTTYGCFLQVKYVTVINFITESRRNTSFHLCQ